MKEDWQPQLRPHVTVQYPVEYTVPLLKGLFQDSLLFRDQATVINKKAGFIFLVKFLFEDLTTHRILKIKGDKEELVAFSEKPGFLRCLR